MFESVLHDSIKILSLQCKKLLSIVLPLVLIAVLNTNAFSQCSYDILATAGEAAPDGNGTFIRFSNFNPDFPVLSDSGEVAFHGRLTGSQFGEHDDEGVFRVTPGGSVVQIGREGQSTPFGQGTLDVFTRLSISDTGDVAFWAFSDFANPLNDTALYRTSNGLVELLVRENGSNPAGGTFFDVAFTPAHGPAGETYFVAEFTDDIGFGRGIFERDALGTLTEVVRSGQPVPDGIGAYTNIGTPVVSMSGQMVFGAFGGIFRNGGGNFSQVVRSGDPSPDDNGVFDDFGSPAISDADQVAFFATLSGTAGGNQNTDNRGIFLETDKSIVQIARQGQPALDGNGLLRFFSDPRVSASGHIAFSGSHNNTAFVNGEDRFAIFWGTEDTLLQIARSGDASPNGEGVFNGFQKLAINQSGTIAFLATHRSGGGLSGIYLFDGAEVIQVARSGDEFDGSTISTLGLAADHRFGRSGLNSSGQVVFEASLADGRREIVLFTPALIGDINRDRAVNLLDVAPFVALINTGQFQVEADTNRDGFVNLLDVGSFVNLLAN